MDTTLELSQAAEKRFQDWFQQVAQPAVHIEVIDREMRSALAAKLQRGAELVYELPGEHTLSQHVERFCVERSELGEANQKRPTPDH